MAPPKNTRRITVATTRAAAFGRRQGKTVTATTTAEAEEEQQERRQHQQQPEQDKAANYEQLGEPDDKADENEVEYVTREDQREQIMFDALNLPV